MKVALFGATGMVGSGVLLECLDFASLREELTGMDGCFFCLGVSSAGMKEADYRRLTYEVTLAAAKVLVAASPLATFVCVSGEGTDSTEHGRSMWARVKGKTENDLLAMPFKAAYMFRPGYIQPLQGVRSKTPVYQAIYNVAALLYPLLRRIIPKYTTTTVNVGVAMIEVAAHGYVHPIIRTSEINTIATGAAVFEGGAR